MPSVTSESSAPKSSLKRRQSRFNLLFTLPPNYMSQSFSKYFVFNIGQRRFPCIPQRQNWSSAVSASHMRDLPSGLGRSVLYQNTKNMITKQYLST